MQKIFLILCAFVIPIFAFAQAPSPAAAAGLVPAKFSPGSVLPVELSKSVDAKKAHTGDPVIGKIPHDLSANGKVIVPKDAKVMGHVAEAKPSSHDNKDSMLGIVFDKIALKDGSEIPLTAEIQAVGAPVSTVAPSSDAPPPENNPTGANQKSEMGAPSNNTAPVGQQQSAQGPSGEPANPPLTGSTQGVVGMKGVTLSQGTMQDSVLTSQDKNVKLESGTQILLRTK
jgi:hypothetical protein